MILEKIWAPGNGYSIETEIYYLRKVPFPIYSKIYRTKPFSYYYFVDVEGIFVNII